MFARDGRFSIHPGIERTGEYSLHIDERDKYERCTYMIPFNVPSR